ncbi:MAG: NifU family protein [Luteibaculaceae bacterium]
MNSDLEQRIEHALEQLRPFLEADGGNITFEYVEGDSAYVKLHGSCATCSMSHMTMKSGVEEAIKKIAPEIKSVVPVA